MSKPKLPGIPEAFSLFGEPLYPQPMRPEVYDTQLKHYEKAVIDWEKTPKDPDAIIWLGRRTAYLGRVREAAGIFSLGVKLHPADSRMYRHRGHRYITLRLFDLAIDDLEKAATLETGKDDAIEQDGLPNDRGIPVSSLQSNIFYHLGLAYYLVGDLDASLGAYEQCIISLKNPDNLVAGSYWKWMILRMLGRDDEARDFVASIEQGLDIIENHDYNDLLTLFAGKITPETMHEKAKSRGNLGIATTGYGIGNYYMVNGDERKAAKIWREVLSTGNWPSFGYIAAETDLKRLSLI